MDNYNQGMYDLHAIVKSLNDKEFETLYQTVKLAREGNSYTYAGVKVSQNLTFIANGNNVSKLRTEYVLLELERIRKNKLLKNSIHKLVRTTGIVDNVKLYPSTALFCLSPCEINGVEIGHTWSRYSPQFKNIRLNSEVFFHSEILKYGDDKSGIDWKETHNVRVKDGDNRILYDIPINDRVLHYDPLGRGKSFDYRHIIFRDGEVYHPLKRILTEDKEIIRLDYSQQLQMDKLVFFEWLTKLEDWEFWNFTTR